MTDRTPPLLDDDDRLPQHTDSASTGDIGVSRTRSIFLEELGWLFREQPSMDYGIDAHVEVVDSRSVLGLLLALQIKGGPRYFRSPSTDGWWFRERKGLFRYWLGHTIPVVVVLVDVGNRVGYWQVVAESTVVRQDGRDWKLEVPRSNVLDKSAVAPLRAIAEVGARRTNDRGPVGAPIGEFSAADLEVHIASPGSDAQAEAPPEYLIRAHDRVLDRLAADALKPEPRSGLVVLVGGSSTGKTRALYEILHRRVGGRNGETSLVEAGWRVWPSLNPLPARRFLEELESVGPRTVIWLNEAQRYLLDPFAELRAEIATALRDLLVDGTRGPVLLLGTLWPEFWVELTRKPATSEVDQFVAARQLIERSYVHVPDTFTSVEVETARRSLDRRVVQAASQDAGIGVTQYLAGGPDLVRRWETADSAQRAVIHAAMDARRLGHREEFSEAFLRDIARCYLEGPDRQHADGDSRWFAEAVAELVRSGTTGVSVLQEGLVGYRLNDFLDQEGRVKRRFEFPSDEFWSLITDSDLPADIRMRLAKGAVSRLRLRIAARLYETTGTPAAGKELCELALHCERRGRPQMAERLVQKAVVAGFPEALMSLVRWRHGRRGHRHFEFMSLLRQAADLGDVEALDLLAYELEQAGAKNEAEAVARRAAELGSWKAMTTVAEWRDLDFPDEAESLVNGLPVGMRAAALTSFAIARDGVDDFDGAERLAFSLLADGKPEALLTIAERRAESGQKEHARWLLGHVTPPESVERMLELAMVHRCAGDHLAARSLIKRAVATATGRKVSKDSAGFDRLGSWFADFVETQPDAVMMLGTVLRTLDERHLEQKLNDEWKRLHPPRPATEILEEEDEYESGSDSDYEVREACTTLAVYHARRGELPQAGSLAFKAASMGSPDGLTALSGELGQRGDRKEAERLALYAVNMGASGDALAEVRGDSTLLVLGLDAAGNTSEPW